MRSAPLVPGLFAGLLATLPAAAITVGTGAPASCTDAALTAAIDQANGEAGLVTFDCGAAPHTIVLASQKSLADGVAIDGGGRITLSGNDAIRIFSLFQGAAVGISNIGLERGFTNAAGGCILAVSSNGNESRLELANVYFGGCTAGDSGGAISASQAFVNVTDSFFEENLAQNGGGGAVSLTDGTLGSTRTTYLSNIANTQGGAIQAWFSQLTLADNVFVVNDTSNTGNGDAGGGAIALRSASAGLTRDRFQNNLSGRNGGGLLLLAQASATLTDTRFEGNGAMKDGGAVYADNSSSATIERSSFRDNRAEDGGAVYSRFQLTIRNATFYQNRAQLRGYAVFTEIGSLDMFGATLVDNQPTAANGSGQIGWSAGTTIGVHNSLIQSPQVAAFACAPSGPASFTATVWDDLTCPEGGAGSRANTVIQLRPYGFSCGGAASELTPTIPLAPVSPALFAGNCRVGDPASDQRGMPRPSGASCDVGAAELFEPCDVPFFQDGFEAGNTQRWSLTLP